MDITPVFNQVLASRNAQLVEPYVFRVENLDEFLKEAYRIVGHVCVASLRGDANNYDSEHISQSSTQISSRYGKATFPLHRRLEESNLPAQTMPPRPQTKTRSTSPTRNATRSTHRQSSRCES
jgi:delta 1-pyrroline-5-carboxylate dehydrogenase